MTISHSEARGNGARASPLRLYAAPIVTYLDADGVIDANDSSVAALAHRLRGAGREGISFARIAFEWVRDEIDHAGDVGDHNPTLTASETLHHGAGLCFAKSHLLAALLRNQGIPAGLCYQRIRVSTDHHVLHGLVAVHLDGRWRRLDPRGNKPGVDAQFSMACERLAWSVRPDCGEIDYRVVFRSTVSAVLKAYAAHRELGRLQLPSGLDATLD